MLLRTWPEIAACLGVPERTAQEWATKHAMPVFKIGGRVYAHKEKLNYWLNEMAKLGLIYEAGGKG